MSLNKQIIKIIRNKPLTFKGTQHQWSKLIRSIALPPDPGSDWVQNKQGEYIDSATKR